MNKESCIIFPGNFREFTRPNVIVGKVKGYLEENHEEANILDLNIEWIHYLLSPKTLAEIKSICEKQFYLLDQKEALSGEEQRKYSSLAWISVMPYDALLLEAERCIYIFRSELFYSLHHLNEANKFITNLENIVNMISLDVDKTFSYLFSSIHMIDETYHSSKIRYHFLIKMLSDLNKYESFIIPVASEAQVLDAFYISRFIKEKYEAKRCIIAGHPVSILKNTFLENKKIFEWIDYAVYGEIENSIYRLIKGEDRLCNISNLIYKDEIGEIHINAQVQSESLYTISYKGINWDRYLSPVRVIPFSLTWGCVWAKCTFCNIHKSALKYKVRAMNEVVDNLQQLMNDCETNVICFIDEALTNDVMSQLASEIIKRKIEIYWTVQTRFDAALNYETFCNIYKSGCRHIEFGLETADEAVQNHMKKGINNKIAHNNLVDARNAGIITTLNIITGYPYNEDFTKTEQFIIDHSRYIDRINNFPFYVTKGSEIEENQEEYGIKVNYNSESQLQINYIDYVAQNGLSRNEIDAQVFQIDNIVSKQNYNLEASMCPILEYSLYFNTTDTIEIVNKTMSIRDTYRTFQMDDIISLRSGVVETKLRFDLITIKKAFLKSIAWTQIASSLPKLMPGNDILYVYNTLNDVVYKSNKDLFWIIHTVSKKMTYENLVMQYSKDFNVSVEYSQVYLNRLCVIYKILQKER